jgi:DNA-binding transcriptional regulator PaaX
LRAAPATPPAAVDGAPTGKLGIIMTAVSTEAGATLAELAAKTGWLPHTTRAALCRLRQRGFAVNLAERDGRKAYRLTVRG